MRWQDATQHVPLSSARGIEPQPRGEPLADGIHFLRNGIVFESALFRIGSSVSSLAKPSSSSSSSRRRRRRNIHTSYIWQRKGFQELVPAAKEKKKKKVNSCRSCAIVICVRTALRSMTTMA
ncbi:hypothetical protein BHE74_00035507 [Ensete ventricosum]|nr:hypothetical protein BHE74_00035507 [Ensete ventricosum]